MKEKTVRMLMRGEISQSVNWVLNNGMWLKWSWAPGEGPLSTLFNIFDSVSVLLWMETPITLQWLTHSADSTSCSHHYGPSSSAQKYSSHLTSTLSLSTSQYKVTHTFFARARYSGTDFDFSDEKTSDPFYYRLDREWVSESSSYTHSHN